MKKFVGVDLHKKLIVICVVDPARQMLTSRRFLNTETAALAVWLKSLGEFELVLEATSSYEWFLKLAEPLARRIVLAHPGKLRVIAESTRKRKDLDITHAGSPILRWALHQAAWQRVRRSPRWKATFEQIAARRGKKKAITAIARRLLCLMLAVIRSGRPYEERPPAAKAA